jgi:putative ABC transport system permease protein
MRVLRQIGAVVTMNLINLPQRTGASLVVVFGVAGVVAVLISVLAMAVGFERTVRGAGSPDRAIILSGSALQESISSIPRDAIPKITSAPGIAKDAAGHPIAAAEALAQVQVPSKSGGKMIKVPLRGIGPEESALRPEVRLIAGREARPGLQELVVGRNIASRYGIGIGDHLSFQSGAWLVVGIFASNEASQFDSQILTDAQALMSAYQRNWFQSLTVRLAGPGSLERLKQALASDPTLHVDAYLESTFAAAQSRLLNTTIRWIGFFIGSMMAAGAMFGALNSLYAAVSTRSIEIATLRSIGFGATPVAISVLAEALLLSVCGALLGAMCAWLLFDGHITSMGVNGLQPPIAFAMAVTPGLVVMGIIWACVIGMIGGLFPAVRAARLPLARALNAIA